MKTIWTHLAIGLLLLAGSCKRDNSTKPISTITAVSKPTAIAHAPLTDDPAYLTNPYDSLGKRHNELLDSLRQYARQTGDTSAAGAGKYLSGYFLKYQGIRLKPSFDPHLGQAIVKDYHPYFFQPGFSAEGQRLVRQMMATLDAVKDPYHFTAYKERMIAVEDQALKGKLPEQERDYILVAGAILRYSGYYWMHDLQNTPAQTDSFFRKLAGLIVGIAADGSVAAISFMTFRANLLLEAVDWSYICGYYTGWYNGV